MRNRPPTRRTAPLAILTVAALASTGLSSPAAYAQEADPGPEQIVNGTFDGGHAPWWGTGNLTLDSSTGRLCADVPGGTVNPWDVIIGQDNVPLVAGETYEFQFFGSATPGKVGKALVQLPVDPYTQYLSANPELSVSGNDYRYTFTSPVDLPNAQVAFQLGGSVEPWTVCLDNVSLRGGAVPDVYVPETGPRVRVNQVGYLPRGPKNATVVTDATAALPWSLRNRTGRVVATGRTTPRGLDASSGQRVHSIDFSRYAATGTGFTLVADGETSRPFDLGTDFYERLRTDALKFYYTQRSGVEILDRLRPGYGRPAGHVGLAPNQGDTAVPCQPGVCDYTLDVSGGWYDAGDHGKYVVNGGISVHQLMSEYERSRRADTAQPWHLGDRTLDLPESGNRVPDILDEARWEQEFLLSMQVPAGKPKAGMAHHKIHDDSWTGLPLLPHLDDKRRELHPPTTAATLNLAATAAQAARVFRPYDKGFADRNLRAAKTAWAAARANPAIYADPADGNGGGAYNDNDVSDEFYWAAAELFLTTGAREYRDAVLASPHHTGDIWRDRGFDWGNTAQLGRLDLATLPSALPDRNRVRASVVQGADRYLATIEAHPYGVPYAPADNLWDWGSNNLIINNAIVLATAFDLTGRDRYRDGVLETMDYLFGRNALNQSYVTGYGEVASRNQHSRWYAHQLNPDLPNPPRGTLSGGPNSAIQDPVAQQKLRGCAPQFCYLDDIESWSTNELTINWNAPLAWIAAFVADQDSGDTHPHH
ncbi:glycoside hydrolase family 9 protein [Micromonospora sp. NBC_01796]|uniref:glycoside hydrolase family 9 protein n=1 Tax=Micromonospora sp. NBC_01796 TaxID=2975987 RepID=UPI002DD8820B|nr:glycoside hydrolase family 9 protein [Micromonospora sp. NBC_01796]WSA87883.1 glycoside hydrolase family 9 protein [Micromonospora sp. NBC_01796]